MAKSAREMKEAQAKDKNNKNEQTIKARRANKCQFERNLVDKITPHGKDSDWASIASKLTRDMNDDVNSTQPKALQNLLLYVFSIEANWERARQSISKAFEAS